MEGDTSVCLCPPLIGLEPPRMRRRGRALSLKMETRAHVLCCWVLSGSGNEQAMTSQRSGDGKKCRLKEAPVERVSLHFCC